MRLWMGERGVYWAGGYGDAQSASGTTWCIEQRSAAVAGGMVQCRAHVSGAYGDLRSAIDLEV